MTTETLEVYKCQVCGIVAEVLDGGAGELICCGQPMVQMSEKGIADEGKEKHVPVIETTDDGIKVKIGSVPHPMEPMHFIQWIEVVAGGRTYRQFLQPGQAPEAAFCVKAEGIIVREMCNKHGLWRA